MSALVIGKFPHRITVKNDVVMVSFDEYPESPEWQKKFPVYGYNSCSEVWFEFTKDKEGEEECREVDRKDVPIYFRKLAQWGAGLPEAPEEE